MSVWQVEKEIMADGERTQEVEDAPVRRGKPGSVTPLGIRTDRGNGLLSSQSLQKDINVRIAEENL